MDDSVLDRFSHEYDCVEAEYLQLLRVAADRDALLASARAVSAAAKAWNSEAYRQYHAEKDDEDKSSLDLLTEVTEALDEMWHGVAFAYAGGRPGSARRSRTGRTRASAYVGQVLRSRRSLPVDGSCPAWTITRNGRRPLLDGNKDTRARSHSRRL